MSYGFGLADAKVTVHGDRFAIWFHGADTTILIARDGGAGGVMRSPGWRDAANTLLATMSCEAVDVYPLDPGINIAWEASYRCPEGVDPRREVAARREAWRAGLVADGAQPVAGGEP